MPTFESAEVVYTADIDGSVETWRVESRTAKTLKVVSEGRHWTWRRSVRSADIGDKWHLAAGAALEQKRAELEREIGFIKQRLQNKRTSLGMIESALKRLESGTSDPAVVAPVDDATGCPRASSSEALSVLSDPRGSGER